MNDIFGDKDWFVVDDILTLQEQNDIGNLLTSNYFPWYLSEYYTVSKEHHDKFKHFLNVKEHIQMVHQFYMARDEDPEYKTEAVSDRKEIIDVLIKKIARYLKKDKLIIARAKANLQHNVTGNKKEYFNTPHVDEPSLKHWVCIYYLNDSDGDTLFFEGDEETAVKKKELKIIHSVSPKKGRFLFFKGNILHTGKHPINTNVRIVINMDFYYD